MPTELLVNVLHLITDDFNAAASLQSELQALGNEGGEWCGFKLMRGVKVRALGKGIFAQTFNRDGDPNRLAACRRIIRAGNFPGKTLSTVLGMTFGQRADSEQVFYEPHRP